MSYPILKDFSDFNPGPSTSREQLVRLLDRRGFFKYTRYCRTEFTLGVFVSNCQEKLLLVTMNSTTIYARIDTLLKSIQPGRVAQSVGHLTRKSGVLGSIPGLATYFRFTFRFFKKGSCQLLAKVCARSTG